MFATFKNMSESGNIIKNPFDQEENEAYRSSVVLISTIKQIFRSARTH